MGQDQERKRSNVRLALILAAVALAIFAAFIWSGVGAQ
ncbi:MAG: cytochrome oxidase small assembly protein [Thiohalobacteraceae bacterium]